VDHVSSAIQRKVARPPPVVETLLILTPQNTGKSVARKRTLIKATINHTRQRPIPGRSGTAFGVTYLAVAAQHEALNRQQLAFGETALRVANKIKLLSRQCAVIGGHSGQFAFWATGRHRLK
jgi:hypothetical protein